MIDAPGVAERVLSNDELRYCVTNEIRAEISRLVGIDPGDRFEGRGMDTTYLRQRTVRVVAKAIVPDSEDADIDEHDLTCLYRLICSHVGIEYSPCARNDWGLNRAPLRAIYRQLVRQWMLEGRPLDRAETSSEEQRLMTDGGGVLKELGECERCDGEAICRIRFLDERGRVALCGDCLDEERGYGESESNE